MYSKDIIVASLDSCLTYFERILNERLCSFFEHREFDENVFDAGFLSEFPSSPLANFKHQYNLSDIEFVFLLTALITHIDQHLIERNVLSLLKANSDFPEIGGLRGTNQRHFIPTIQTALFIIAGNQRSKMLEARNIFNSEHRLIKDQVLIIEAPGKGEPFTNSVFSMEEEYISLFTTGKIEVPVYNSSFPAMYLITSAYWDSLVVNDLVKQGIMDVRTWLQNKNAYDHSIDLHHKRANGYKVLLHGPSGTGKTLTATLFGKDVNYKVFRIDLALLFSNNKEEIETIIENLFRKAERRTWILLINQAESLFEKNDVKNNLSAVYSNLFIPYLLERIDFFPGIVFFETNSIEKIDKTFLNKLQQKIEFTLPSILERKQLWSIYLPARFSLSKDVDIVKIAEKYSLTGAEISNSIESITIKAIKRNEYYITMEDIVSVIEGLYGIPKKGNVGAFNADPLSMNLDKKEIKVFISYSSRDRKMRNLLVDGLKAHLKHKPVIQYSLWEDSQIDMGSNWQDKIEQALSNANVAILLVSASFASSEYILSNELTQLFQNTKEHKSLVLPVLIRNFNFQDFTQLSSLNFFKPYYSDYGFNDPTLSHRLIPFDVLGDDEKPSDRKLQDYYRTLSDHIHVAVTNYFK